MTRVKRGPWARNPQLLDAPMLARVLAVMRLREACAARSWGVSPRASPSSVSPWEQRHGAGWPGVSVSWMALAGLCPPAPEQARTLPGPACSPGLPRQPLPPTPPRATVPTSGWCFQRAGGVGGPEPGGACLREQCGSHRWGCGNQSVRRRSPAPGRRGWRRWPEAGGPDHLTRGPGPPNPSPKTIGRPSTLDPRGCRGHCRPEVPRGRGTSRAQGQPQLQLDAAWMWPRPPGSASGKQLPRRQSPEEPRPEEGTIKPRGQS
ncbi:translation initiation factor IF-2-like isoform X2 [Pteropus medius]|uniref:translation initiation factor IF-2-like isoform X2 n=1 Tax=Pteropus vampyrus TaxID=132908 RepID=UPI00196A9F77|nr:translation initiation factor IF-2-like isoform X2 [Pteropus giganteus]